MNEANASVGRGYLRSRSPSTNIIHNTFIKAAVKRSPEVFDGECRTYSESRFEGEKDSFVCQVRRVSELSEACRGE